MASAVKNTGEQPVGGPGPDGIADVACGALEVSEPPNLLYMNEFCFEMSLETSGGRICIRVIRELGCAAERVQCYLGLLKALARLY